MQQEQQTPHKDSPSSLPSAPFSRQMVKNAPRSGQIFDGDGASDPSGDESQQPVHISAENNNPPKDTTDKAKDQEKERKEEPSSEPQARGKVAQQSGTDHAAERKRQMPHDDGDSAASGP